MKGKYLLESIEIERARRLKGLKVVDTNALHLWNKVLKLLGTNNDKSEILKAYSFAKKIDYKHEGLNPDIYFAHPLRVASYSFLHVQPNNLDILIIGLIHNIFELSNYSRDDIQTLFGEKIKNQISNLTVNRALQYDSKYKYEYYRNIINGPFEARVVKVFDKIDNLFTLSLNPDDSVREKYLKEIEEYVLPMAKRDLPLIFDYISELVRFNYKVGYLTK